MKKIIKKMVAVTLTLVMVLAMSVPALAAENKVTVKVKLDAAVKWDKCSLYYWTDAKSDYVSWPGTAMKSADGSYTLDVTIDGDKFNIIANNGASEGTVQTSDIKDVSTSKGVVVVTVTMGADGKPVGAVTYQTAPATGDSTTVVPYVLLAVVAGCGAVYTFKKRAEA